MDQLFVTPAGIVAVPNPEDDTLLRARLVEPEPVRRARREPARVPVDLLLDRHGALVWSEIMALA